MSNATQFASQAKNGKPSVALTEQTPLATAIKLMQQGDVAPAVFLDWATKTPIDLTECFALVGAIGQKDFAIVMDAQRQMIAKAAAARSIGTFTMKATEKGCIQFRGVPGAPVKFGLTMYVSCIEFLLDHADDIRAWIASNNSKLSRK